MKPNRSSSRIATALLFCLVALLSGFGSAKAKSLVYAEWFIDNDPGQGNGNAITPCDGVFDQAEEEFCFSNISVPPDLTVGRHTFVLRLKDSDSAWSFRKMTFYATSSSPYVNKTLTAAEYFIDKDPGEGVGNPLGASDGSVDEAIENLVKDSLESKNLDIGDHVLGVRARDSYSVWGTTRKLSFRVIASSPYKHIIASEYFIDTDPGFGSGYPLPPADSLYDSSIEEAILADAPTASLSLGQHVLYVRFRDNMMDSLGFTGWGPVRSIPFIVEDLGRFQLIAPNGGEEWICMHNERAVWSSPHASVDSTVVLLSFDDGRTYELYLGSAPGSDTTLSWKSTSSQAYWSDSCRIIAIYFRSDGSSVYDNSDNDFAFHSPGDADCSGDIDIADAAALVNYVFVPGTIPCRPEALDANCDGDVDIADPVWLIRVVFGNEQPCPDSHPLAKETGRSITLAVKQDSQPPESGCDLYVTTPVPLSALDLRISLPADLIRTCSLSSDFAGWTMQWRAEGDSAIELGMVDLSGTSPISEGLTRVVTMKSHVPLPDRVVQQISGIAVDNNGAKYDIRISPNVAASVPLVPTEFSLSQNFPNPFNPVTSIRYSMPHAGAVELAVFNITGQRVRTLISGQAAAGSYVVIWDGRDDNGNVVASGVYLYRLSARDFTTSRKMIMLK
jgi:hypothetical protein